MTVYEIIFQEGFEQSFQESIELGRKEEKIRVTQRGYKYGIPKETLVLVTGFSIEKVEEIINLER